MRVERARVGDVLQLQRRSVSMKPDGQYTLVGCYSFGRGLFHRDPQLGSDLGTYKYFEVRPGDLVLSNIQAWEGAIAFATEADAGTVGTHRFLTYTSRVPDLDLNWLRWFLLSEPGMELIRKAAPGTTMRNRTLAIDRFENLEIPLPPIEDQRRVAAQLDRIATSSVALYALQGKAAALAGALQSSITSPPGEGSTGWSSLSLSDVLELKCEEVSVSPEDTYRMAGVLSFGRGLFARADLAGSGTSYAKLHRLGEGQVVLSRLKAWEGAIALVPPGFHGYFLSPEFPTFDVNSELADADFLAALLASPHFWVRLKGQSKGVGARKERVTAERFLAQVVRLPPVHIQSALSARLRWLSSVGARADTRTARVEALLPSALNAAFTDLS